MFGRVGHSARGGGSVSRAQVANVALEVARGVLETTQFDEQVNEVLAEATFEGATYVADDEPSGATVGDVSLITAAGTTTTNPGTTGLSGESGTTTVLTDTRYVYVTAHVHDTVIVTPVAPLGFDQWLGPPFSTWWKTEAGQMSVAADTDGKYRTTWTGGVRGPADVRLVL
ncbi:MAG: hypothetical protein CMO44_17420 [Verrucomicrobiales bacterium]|nr:hypothetical protein [Verrucomicrobiales bacterium]